MVRKVEDNFISRTFVPHIFFFRTLYHSNSLFFQTPSGVSSKVMDDYCWIHSTFHVRSEYQGNVGCIVDNTLAGRESIRMAASDTPDTAFYQWVPFTLVFQVSMIEFLRGKVSLGNFLAKK